MESQEDLLMEPDVQNILAHVTRQALLELRAAQICQQDGVFEIKIGSRTLTTRAIIDTSVSMLRHIYPPVV